MNYLYRVICISCVILSININHVLSQDRARTQFQEYSTGVGSYIQGIPVTKDPIKGSIYLFEEYSPGILITNKKEEISDVNLRYNLKEQKIEMKRDDLDIQLNSKLIHSFHINDGSNDKFLNVAKLPTDQNHGLDGFVQVLDKHDDSMLLQRWYLNIKKANYNVAISTGNKYDEAILKNEILILLNNELIPFKGQNREIKRLFPDHSKMLLDYKKDNNLNFKNEEDFISFFNYLLELE